MFNSVNTILSNAYTTISPNSVIAKLLTNNTSDNTTSYSVVNSNGLVRNILNNNTSTSSSFMKDITSVMNTKMSTVTPNELVNKNDIVAKPVGEKEYIYTPPRSEVSNINGSKITVNDFNVNLSGTLKLDGGNTFKNIDMNELLNDFQFMNALKEMIKTSINNDMNNGRFMNDWATRRGFISPLSIIGK